MNAYTKSKFDRADAAERRYRKTQNTTMKNTETEIELIAALEQLLDAYAPRQMRPPPSAVKIPCISPSARPEQLSPVAKEE